VWQISAQGFGGKGERSMMELRRLRLGVMLLALSTCGVLLWLIYGV
jgi:hypothetical protein